ncbi:MAG: hypothetical protein JSV96_14870 [Candidatus Aminicenantes bacterium]|nr:MAG: hypothetical protein JSV96_14870 [Candidatus Aminicenantes bacterium]
MLRKSLFVLGIILLLLVMQNCSSKPEQGLLERYFHALTLNDRTTLGTMALEPISIAAENWEIINVIDEEPQPASLPELNQAELNLKKKVEESVVITIEAKEEVDDAEWELDRARTRSAKRAAQKKVDELSEKYKEIRTRHDQLQKDYSDAKTVASREEEITAFSLGERAIPNIRDLTGEVHKKVVEVRAETEAGPKSYNFYLRQYNLRDENLNLNRRGRWVIIKIESVG